MVDAKKRKKPALEGAARRRKTGGERMKLRVTGESLKRLRASFPHVKVKGCRKEGGNVVARATGRRGASRKRGIKILAKTTPELIS